MTNEIYAHFAINNARACWEINWKLNEFVYHQANDNRPFDDDKKEKQTLTIGYLKMEVRSLVFFFYSERFVSLLLFFFVVPSISFRLELKKLQTKN